MNTFKTMMLALMLIILSVSELVTPIFVQLAHAGENTKYRLTVNATPSDSRIRIMNIKPKYRHGIMLKPGKYDIEVTRTGYESKRGWVEIKDADLSLDVTLNKLGGKEQRTEEMPLEQFETEFFTALQSQNDKKIEQLFISHPNTAEQYQHFLTHIGEGVGEEAEQTRALATLVREIRQEAILRSFVNEFLIAWQAQDFEKIKQLFIKNPETAKQFQQVLARAGKDELAGLVANWLEMLNLHDFHPELNRLWEEGEKAYYRSKYTIALKKWHKGLEKAQKIDNKSYISLFLNNIGRVYGDLGEYPKALNYYQQALAIDRELGDKRGEGGNLANIGVVYDDLSNYPKALEYYQQALAIHQTIDDKHGLGRDLSNIGVVYRNLDDYPKALDYYQQALAIRQAIGDKHGQGADLSNIGVVYKNLGEYPKALDYYQQALVISKEIGDRRLQGANLSNIGVVYKNLDDYPKALDYYQQALAIRQAIGDKRGQGADLSNIGVVYLKLGNYPKALEYCQQALAIHQAIGDKRGQGGNLSNIGTVYLALGDYPKVLEYYQQALAIHQAIGDKHGQGMTLFNIGIVYQSFGEYQKAMDIFQESLIIKESIGAYNTWTSQRGLAFTETKLNQLESAIQHYEQAIDNIEKLRATLNKKEHKQHKISFMRDKLYVYDEFIALLQSIHLNYPKKNYDRKAIEIFERKQGRIFLEEMGQNGARRFTGLPNDIIQQEQTLAHQWQQKSRSPQEWETLEKEQAKFEAMLAKKYPKYHALKYSQPVDLATLQNQVLQEGEMMLVYNVIPEEAYVELESQTILWIIGKKQFQMLTLNISEKGLQAQVEAFRQSPNNMIKAIKEKRFWDITDIDETLPPFRQPSYELYTLLFPKTAKTLLKGARTLYIVPTGALYGLPFGALDTHNPAQHDTPHYLIQDYSIAYLSSASLLKTIRDTKRDKTSHRYPLLAFAHPKYPKNCSSKSAEAAQVIQTMRTENYLKLASSGNDACFTELPETQVQAQAIAKLLKAPKRSNALQLRAKASRRNVFHFSDTQRLDDYQYVLFAAHAVLPYEITHINQSAIVLSNPDTEGYLTMADAFALQLNADLVMLSACNTGGGENIRGEGVRGLTRAFMYAGTPAVSVSLWSVESQSAKALSIRLFKYLKAGKPLAQALRQSKLDLMAEEDFEMYQHPYFWAPFVVFGDGN